MKISLIASRYLVGSMALSLSALSLYATDVTTKAEFETNFVKQEGTNNYKNKNNNATLAIKLPTTAAKEVQALLGANGRIVIDNANQEITLGAANTDILALLWQTLRTQTINSMGLTSQALTQMESPMEEHSMSARIPLSQGNLQITRH